MNHFCNLEDLVSESDVEQKLLMPLLTQKSPLGLEFDKSTILTKHRISSLLIGKGVQKKYYFPDYIIQINGLPIIIIEAKSPADRNLEEAAREARLYATELNAKYPSGINPCRGIIVSNGLETIALDADSIQESVSMKFDELNPSNDLFLNFIEKFQVKSFSQYAKDITTKLKPEREFSKPTSLLGGQSVKHQEISPNALGEVITAEFRHIFNPIEINERKNVAKNAYVRSQRREKHSEPLTRIIKSAIPTTLKEVGMIEDIENPVEIVEILTQNDLRNEVMLLIGSVGSGKTTFVDHFIECVLPKDLKNTTNWVRLDMNLAPLDKNEIYSWLPLRIIESLRISHPKIDFDDLETIQKIFSNEVNAFKRGLGRLLEGDAIKFNEKLYEVIFGLQQNLLKTAICYNRYLCSQRDILLVLVLDNCDKRSVDDQLLMFEVARWLKEQFRCLVIIPMRDTTFDTFRKEPPLDTVVKDLVFRIDSPSLSAVILKRIEYVFNNMKSVKGIEEFELSNGMKVSYPRTDHGNFLRCILTSLFDHENYVRRVIEGLAGKNIRKGLEIFLDICKSGHIDNDELFTIRQSNGDHVIPWNKLMRSMMKGGRKFYDDRSTHIKNIFSSDLEFDPPNPFIRWFILGWLKMNYTKYGPSGDRGFHRVDSLINDLVPMGFDRQNIIVNLITLQKSNYILAEESLVATSLNFTDETLLSIAPAGHILLDLITDQTYLSICAEDIWFSQRAFADEVRKRMISEKSASQHSALLNSKIIKSFLVEYIEYFIPKSEPLINGQDFKQFINFHDFENKITQQLKMKNMLLTEAEISDLYPKGRILSGTLVHISKNTIIVDFGDISGASPGSLFPESLKKFTIGDQVTAKIHGFSTKHYKLDIEIINDLEEQMEINI